VFKMASMDKLFSTCGFDLMDIEELIAELPTSREIWDAPGFDRVLFHADPSDMAVTAMEYEGEWAAVPSYRGGEQALGTIYRATPYIGIVETGDLRFAALADAPFALPAGNPVGGEKLEGQVQPAVVGLRVGGGGAGAGGPAWAGTAMRAVPVARAAAAPAATRRFLIMVCPLLSMSRHPMRCSRRLCPADTT